MTLTRTFTFAAAAGAIALLAGCATPHYHGDGPGHMHGGTYGGMHGGMHGGMYGSAREDMRQRMAAARTPEERQALMNEQMQAMHDGAGMMRGMPTDPAWREQMQSQCAEMMKSINATPPASK